MHCWILQNIGSRILLYDKIDENLSEDYVGASVTSCPNKALWNIELCKPLLEQMMGKASFTMYSISHCVHALLIKQYGLKN